MPRPKVGSTTTTADTCHSFQLNLGRKCQCPYPDLSNECGKIFEVWIQIHLNLISEGVLSRSSVGVYPSAIFSSEDVTDRLPPRIDFAKFLGKRWASGLGVPKLLISGEGPVSFSAIEGALKALVWYRWKLLTAGEVRSGGARPGRQRDPQGSRWTSHHTYLALVCTLRSGLKNENEELIEIRNDIILFHIFPRKTS